MKRIRTERRTAARWLISLGLASALHAAPAHSEEGSRQKEQARIHFGRGIKLVKLDQYREALAEFQLAYAASPHFSVLYNIGQAQTLLERPSEACRTLQHYLDEGGAQIDAARRAAVEASILREQEKTGSVEVSVDVAGALLTLDAEPLGRSPLAAPVRVDPGAHRLKASLDSGISREITIEVAAKQLVPARLELAPAPAPAPVSLAPPVQAPLVPANDTHPAPPAPSPITPDHSAQKTWGYVVGAAGLALSAVAVSHYLWNRNRYDEWRSRSNAYYVDPTDQHRESANSLGRSIPAASAVTVGLTIGAGVALGTGAVLLITSSPSSADSGAQARSTLVRLQGEF